MPIWFWWKLEQKSEWASIERFSTLAGLTLAENVLHVHNSTPIWTVFLYIFQLFPFDKHPIDVKHEKSLLNPIYW